MELFATPVLAPVPAAAVPSGLKPSAFRKNFVDTGITPIIKVTKKAARIDMREVAKSVEIMKRAGGYDGLLALFEEYGDLDAILAALDADDNGQPVAA